MYVVKPTVNDTTSASRVVKHTPVGVA